MKLVIFGATGATGREIVRQALAAGHEVRAAARSAKALAGLDPRLEIVPGDVRTKASIDAAIAGRDAVLSALGTGTSLQPTTLMSEGTAAILRGMDGAGIRRLICITSGGVLDNPSEPFLFRLIGRRMLRNVFEDHRRLEAKVRESPLDWTIVRPPRLLDRPSTGVYRLAREAAIPGGNDIARADVAHFMLRELEERAYLRAAVAIGY